MSHGWGSCSGGGISMELGFGGGAGLVWFTELEVLGNQPWELQISNWKKVNILGFSQGGYSQRKWKARIQNKKRPPLFGMTHPGTCLSPVLLSPGKLSVLGGNSGWQAFSRALELGFARCPDFKTMEKTLQNPEAVSIPPNPQAFETGPQILTLQLQAREHFGILSCTETKNNLDGLSHNTCFVLFR